MEYAKYLFAYVGRLTLYWVFPRVAQRDVHSSEMALQAHLTFALFSGEEAVIPLPYKSKRAVKGVLKPNY